jgi:hypothetical protein
MRQLEKAIGPVPAWVEQPWALKIGDLFDASISRTFNIKRDSNIDPLILGILTAQSANCSEMNFVPLLKAKNVSHKAKKLPSLVSPLQRMLGQLSQRILRVMARQPAEIQIAFQNGYARALAKKMYTGVNPIFWETPATRIYCVLLMLAPCMHRVKSVSHLHKILTVILGESVVGALNDVKQSKRLGKLCERIELRFPRGRPRSEAVA